MTFDRDEEVDPPGAPILVHVAISDLFYNYDHGDAILYTARGDFRGYDPVALRANAETLMENLSALGVEDLPTVEELVTDFYSRI